MINLKASWSDYEFSFMNRRNAIISVLCMLLLAVMWVPMVMTSYTLMDSVHTNNAIVSSSKEKLLKVEAASEDGGFMAEGGKLYAPGSVSQVVPVSRHVGSKYYSENQKVLIVPLDFKTTVVHGKNLISLFFLTWIIELVHRLFIRAKNPNEGYLKVSRLCYPWYVRLLRLGIGIASIWSLMAWFWPMV